MPGLTRNEERVYVTVLSDGTLRQKVTKETPGAVLREYETSDGKKGEKYEIVYKEIEGDVYDININEGSFGKFLNLTIVWEGGDAVLSVNVATPFGEDLLKKLPNVNFRLPVRLRPYSFEDDGGKQRRGFSIYQPQGKEWEKLTNFFWDPETKENLHGFPVPEGNIKQYDSEDWKMYYLKARKFLVRYCESRIIPDIKQNVNTYGGAPASGGMQADEAQPVEVMDESDNPF